jgi:hypothetical protein
MVPKSIPSAGNFKDNLVFKNLITEMNPTEVYELSNKKAILGFFMRLVNKKAGAMSRAISTNTIVSANRGLDFIQATIQDRTVSGSDLILKFDQPVEAARIGDIAFYNIKWDRQGRVVEKQNGVGGFVKVTPAPGVSAFVGTDFPVGAKLGLYGDLRQNTPSGPKERRFLNPDLEENYLSTSREGLWNARYEKVSTRVSTTGTTPTVYEFEGQWWTSMQQDMVYRMELSRELDLAFSTKGIQVESDGEYSRNGGVRWTVINRGGIYMPFSTAITRDYIESAFQQLAIQTLGSTSPIMFFCGMGLWNAINKVYEDQIRETGKLNTFGGEDVKGYNIPVFYVPGLNREVAMITIPILNEPELGGLGAKTTITEYANYTLGQMTGFAMTDVMFQDAISGAFLPQFTKYHFGQKEYMVGQLKGMDSAVRNSLSDGNFANALGSTIDSIEEVGTLIDVTELSILTQQGIDGYGRGVLWMEPTK